VAPFRHSKEKAERIRERTTKGKVEIMHIPHAFWGKGEQIPRMQRDCSDNEKSGVKGGNQNEATKGGKKRPMIPA